MTLQAQNSESLAVVCLCKCFDFRRGKSLLNSIECVYNNIILRHLLQNRNWDGGDNNNKQKLNQTGLSAQENYPDSKNWARNKPTGRGEAGMDGVVTASIKNDRSAV